MPEKLTLSDPHGDTAPGAVADAVVKKAARNRIRELEQNVATLEQLMADKKKLKKLEQRIATASNKIGARKDAGFKAVSSAPSINNTPLGPTMVPVAYPTVQDLGNSVNAAKSVRFNGSPAYLLDATSQPGCQGDQAGSGGGIRSDTVGGEVRPVTGSSTLRIEGKRVVREGDACTMNGGNNPGTYGHLELPVDFVGAIKIWRSRARRRCRPSRAGAYLQSEFARFQQFGRISGVGTP